MDYTIKLTGTCNKACSYCHQTKINKSVSREAIREFITSLSSKHKEFTLTLFGGEPLIEMEKIEYISTLFEAKNIKLILYTNFDLYTPNLLEVLSRFRDFEVMVNISTEFFDPEILFRRPKMKRIMSLIKLLGTKVLTTVVIDRYNVKMLEKYAYKYEKFKNELKELNIVFSTEFLSNSMDYSIEDWYKLFVFYDMFEGCVSFSNTYYPFRNMLNDLNCHSEECDICAENELTLDIDGMVVPCRRFTNHRYSKEEIEQIEEDTKICKTCKFKGVCDPCKYSHYGINHRELKCRRIYNVIKALEMLELYGNSKFLKPDPFILNVYLGNRCNKNCYFCYNHTRFPEQKEFNLKKFLEFSKNNYWGASEIDSLVGGEPALYITEEYRELERYYKEVLVFTNGYIYNKELATNPLYRLVLSIHDLDFHKILFESYKNNIEYIQVVATEEILRASFEIIPKLMEWGKPFIYSEIYSYEDRKIEPSREAIEIFYRALKFFNLNPLEYLRKNKADCLVAANKIGYDMDKITVCRSIYELHKYSEKYILSETPENYVFDKKQIQRVLGETNGKCPIADCYGGDRNIVHKTIIELERKDNNEKN